MGGTFLHHSRAHPGKVKADDLPDFLAVSRRAVANGDRFGCTPHVLAVIEALGVDGLISIPKTMNNDVYGIDYCIGFSNAITRNVDAITVLMTPTGSHERIAIVELFGRNSD